MILGRKEVRTIAYVTNSYIEHSGILGMKWGQRNGPPYPIRDGGHSAAEVKANPKLGRSSSSGGSSSGSNQQQQTKVKYRHNPRHYSDEELQEHLDRMRAEEEYRKLNGQLTKQQLNDIKNRVASNIFGTATNELPKAAIAVGKEVYTLERTFWKKVLVGSIPEIAKSIGQTFVEAAKAVNSNKGSADNKSSDNSGDNSPLITMHHPRMRYKQKVARNGKKIGRAH